MLYNYDDTMLMEMKRTNLQKLQVVKRLKITLEGNIKTIDELMGIRRLNAEMEAEIQVLQARQETLKENLDAAGTKGNGAKV